MELRDRGWWWPSVTQTTPNSEVGVVAHKTSRQWGFYLLVTNGGGQVGEKMAEGVRKSRSKLQITNFFEFFSQTSVFFALFNLRFCASIFQLFFPTFNFELQLNFFHRHWFFKNSFSDIRYFTPTDRNEIFLTTINFLQRLPHKILSLST